MQTTTEKAKGLANSLPNAGLSPATTPRQGGSRRVLPPSSEHGIDPDLLPNPPDVSCGIITSGACSSPEAQAYFDEFVVGHPPEDDI